MSICFFAGHSEVPEWIQDALDDAVERHITEYGVSDFLVGNYGGFDRIAAQVVAEAKKRHPGVSLYLMLAYSPAENFIYEAEYFDGLILPEGQENVPPKAAIPRLNRHMADESDYMIAYVSHISSGAYNTLQYAQGRQGKIKITNLNDFRLGQM